VAAVPRFGGQRVSALGKANHGPATPATSFFAFALNPKVLASKFTHLIYDNLCNLRVKTEWFVNRTIPNDFTSAIYNDRPGRHDAGTFGET
jgi:hypothetical protein